VVAALQRRGRARAPFALAALVASLTLAAWLSTRPDPPNAPAHVTLVGTVREAAGCAPEGPCAPLELTALRHRPGFLEALTHVQRRYLVQSITPVWTVTRKVPAGRFTFRAQVDDVVYGGGGRPEGAELELTLPEERTVTFLYSQDQHLVTADAMEPIVVATGSFQRLLGCERDDDPSCLLSWLVDDDGDGRYTRTTRLLPPGEYQVSAALLGDASVGLATHFTVLRNAEEVKLVWTAGATEVSVEFPDGRPAPGP
jgi:hypothetical protein